MKKIVIAVWTIAALGWASANSSKPIPGHTDPHSFIAKNVSSPAGLAQHIKSDPRVARRYEKHYGIDAQWLAEYISKNLRATTLQRAETFTVYHVKEDGKVYPKRIQFKKGTAVFSTVKGNPVMKVSCGNPLSTSLPLAPAPIAPLTEITSAPKFEPTVTTDVPAETEPEPIKEVLTSAPTVPALPSLDVPRIEFPAAANTPVTDAPVTEAPPVVAPLPPSIPTVPLDTPIIAQPGSWSPLLPIGLIIGGAIAINDKPDPVPEPASIATIGLGLAALYRFKGRSSKTRSSSSKKNLK